MTSRRTTQFNSNKRKGIKLKRKSFSFSQAPRTVSSIGYFVDFTVDRFKLENIKLNFGQEVILKSSIL